MYFSFSLSSGRKDIFNRRKGGNKNMCSNCGCGHDEHNHDDQKKDWEEHLKSMSKEELAMKKEKLEKKLALVKKLLGGKK